MRIGQEFQAEVPPLSAMYSAPGPALIPQGSGSILVWTPTRDLKDEDCELLCVCFENDHIFIGLCLQFFLGAIHLLIARLSLR